MIVAGMGFAADKAVDMLIVVVDMLIVVADMMVAADSQAADSQAADRPDAAVGVGKQEAAVDIQKAVVVAEGQQSKLYTIQKPLQNLEDYQSHSPSVLQRSYP